MDNWTKTPSLDADRIKHAILSNRHFIRIPVDNEQEGPFVELALVQVSKDGPRLREEKLALIGGRSNSQGLRTFYALFTQKQADFKIIVRNNSESRVRQV